MKRFFSLSKKINTHILAPFNTIVMPDMRFTSWFTDP